MGGIYCLGEGAGIFRNWGSIHFLAFYGIAAGTGACTL